MNYNTPPHTAADIRIITTFSAGSATVGPHAQVDWGHDYLSVEATTWSAARIQYPATLQRSSHMIVCQAMIRHLSLIVLLLSVAGK